ncbi:MAG: tyrosine-type recombinase/integrase [Proteobacteria bacterium]|nr:tyrosine-type recombinase/integrase [Pseudomonadota bacterium]
MKLELEYLVSFKKYLKFQEFKSEATIRSYNSDLKALYLYLKQNNLEFNEDVVFLYVEHLSKDRAFTWRSQSRVISSIKSFCKYLLLKNLASDNFARDVEFPKKGRDLPKAITHNILQKVIEDDSLQGKTAVLARTILIVFYATGLRISELIKLTVSDLEENQGKALKVKGKGGKFRLVPLGEIAAEVLSVHLSEVKNNFKYANSDIHYVFQSVKKNKAGKYGHITRQHVYKLIKSLGIKYGVDITPHSLRHSFATELVKNDADLRTVQLMLGHSDLSTTQIYTKIADSQAYNSLLQNHPLSKVVKTT